MDGAVPLKDVLHVLAQFGVNVVTLSDGALSMGRDGCVPEVHRLGDDVRRRMVGYLAQKFGIPTHLFWHPDQVQEWKAAKAEHSKRADPN